MLVAAAATEVAAERPPKDGMLKSPKEEPPPVGIEIDGMLKPLNEGIENDGMESCGTGDAVLKLARAAR